MYAQADEDEKPRLSLKGLLIYGAADTPHDDARGLEYYTQLRKRQRTIRKDISDLRQMQRREEQPDEP